MPESIQRPAARFVDGIFIEIIIDADFQLIAPPSKLKEVAEKKKGDFAIATKWAFFACNKLLLAVDPLLRVYAIKKKKLKVAPKENKDDPGVTMMHFCAAMRPVNSVPVGPQKLRDDVLERIGLHGGSDLL